MRCLAVRPVRPRSGTTAVMLLLCGGRRLQVAKAMIEVREFLKSLRFAGNLEDKRRISKLASARAWEARRVCTYIFVCVYVCVCACAWCVCVCVCAYVCVCVCVCVPCSTELCW